MQDKIAVSHVDTLLNRYSDQEYDFKKSNKKFHVDLPKIKKSNVKMIIFAVFVEENYMDNKKGLKKTIKMIDDFYQLIDSNSELKVAKNGEDIKDIIEKDKIAALLAIEGAKSIFDLSALRIFNRLKVRLISLTWNHKNQYGDGVGEKSERGLTRNGKDFVEEMNRLKIAVDVSHLNNRGFWDVIKISRVPVIASHSNAKNICDHPRNLSDKQIKAIADSNGFIGINFCPSFLTDKKGVDIKDVIRHIDYIKNLVGVKYIALGTDYDGIQNTPSGLEDISKLSNLKTEMLRNGYSEYEIKAIFFDNIQRVLTEIFDG